MVFSSNVFLFIYLPCVLITYYILDKRFKNIFLTLASLIFYAWGEPKFVWIMLFSICINYAMGLCIYYSKGKGIFLRRSCLVLTVLLNLGLLFYFKYFGFFISILNDLLSLDIKIRTIALPIGISFFTFQGMSYTLDLYMEKVDVQKNPLNIALYIALFPQLIAGPIVRYKDVNDQIDKRYVDIEKFAVGIQRFSFGLAKKVIIANQLGAVADEIFSVVPHENLISTAWLGILCYTFQIFFDFSGYSDMAIGLGKMFGFDFLENFNYPYISKSVTEFWRRWHISLSTWFRDYIYIPLGGNRKGNVYFNSFIVFLVTGLWHGASWNFVLWGLWHGCFLIIEKICKKRNIHITMPLVFQWLYCMLIVIVGWVLFRCENLTLGIEYLKVMFGIQKSQNVGFSLGWYLNLKVIIILVIGVIASIPWKEKFSTLLNGKNEKNDIMMLMLKNIYCIGLMMISIMLMMASNYNPFIYFRF